VCVCVWYAPFFMYHVVCIHTWVYIGMHGTTYIGYVPLFFYGTEYTYAIQVVRTRGGTMDCWIMTREDLARNLVRHHGNKDFRCKVREDGIVVVTWSVEGRGGRWEMYGFTAEIG
jgi:hypothetical protein